jgi:hypothetical protein
MASEDPRLAEGTARQVFEQYVEAMNRADFDALGRLHHSDYVEDYPQSGERIRGFPALRAMFEHYPGGVRGGTASNHRFLGEERWVMTPGYTVVPMAGTDTYTSILKNRYPDGSIWHIVSFFQLRDGLISRRTSYFAPEFEPPEWRRGIAEPIPASER